MASFSPGALHEITEFFLQHLRVEQLLAVLPLVEGLGFVEPFVALQPDQRLAGQQSRGLGKLRLADAGRAFDQNGLLEVACQVDDGRDGAIADVVLTGETLDDFFD